MEDQTVDLVFKQKLEKQEKIKKAKRKRRNRKIITFLIIITVGVIYFNSDFSKPKAVIISGNNILSKDEVLDVAKVSDDSRLIMAQPFLIKRNLKSHPFVKNSSVSTSYFKRTIQIHIDELEIFAYRYKDDETYMILNDGSSEVLSSDLYQYLKDLIYITGFSEDEDQIRLAKSFAEVEESITSQISEIHQTSVSYDDKLLEILMNDGNKVYTSFQTVERLNYYFDIIMGLKASNSCIYIDELSGEAYSQNCSQNQESE